MEPRAQCTGLNQSKRFQSRGRAYPGKALARPRQQATNRWEETESRLR